MYRLIGDLVFVGIICKTKVRIPNVVLFDDLNIGSF